LKVNTRKEREKLFHEQAFATGTRRSVRRLYSELTMIRTFLMDRLTAYGRGKRVLEYGCGSGELAVYLASNDAYVTGIDLSERAIQMAEERAGYESEKDRISFQVMDAENMTFPAGSFDLVYGTGVLHHLDLDRALSETCRVLSTRGIAIFAEPLGHNPFINLFRKLTPRLRTTDEHPLLKKDLVKIESYFREIDFFYFYLFSMLAVPFCRFPGFRWLIHGLELFDKFLFSLIPWIRMQAWQIVMILSEPKLLSSEKD